MSRQPWFDEYFWADLTWGPRYREFRHPDDMRANASIGRSSMEDVQRAQLRRAADDDGDEGRRARLWLATEVLWYAVRDAFDLTDADLYAVVDELDRSDGVADGRRTFPPRSCPSCAARVPAGRDSCQICGAQAPRPSLFP